jgi:predicted DNA-binding ribbon-helix-helix protein
MKSRVVKRSIVIAGHKTSVSLEDAFWQALKDIALAQHTTLSDLVAAIDKDRRHGNLSSAIRLFVLEHFQARADGGGNGEPDDNAGADGSDPEDAQIAAEQMTRKMRAPATAMPACLPPAPTASTRL